MLGHTYDSISGRTIHVSSCEDQYTMFQNQLRMLLLTNEPGGWHVHICANAVGMSGAWTPNDVLANENAGHCTVIKHLLHLPQSTYDC